MAIRVFQIQHAFQGITGLPVDRYTNTWYVVSHDGTAIDTAWLTDIAAAVEGFYQHTPGAITASMSPNAAGDGEVTKIYDMGDPKPRTPLFTRTSPGAGMSGTPLPNEVAVCMSYRAQLVSGIPPARRRGRLFLGPWSTSALDSVHVGDARVLPALRTNILAAAGAFNTTVVAHGADWSVFSPTEGGAAKIVHVSVDNAFDTQRRRGMIPNNVTQLDLTS